MKLNIALGCALLANSSTKLWMVHGLLPMGPERLSLLWHMRPRNPGCNGGEIGGSHTVEDMATNEAESGAVGQHSGECVTVAELHPVRC